MYSQIDKLKEKKSRAVAHSVAQNKSICKQGVGFVDNRPEAKKTTQLRGMLNSCQDNSRHLRITQLVAEKVSEEGGVGSSYNKVVYQDKASNFKGGDDAGDKGLWPVGRGVIKGEYYDGVNWVDIADGSEAIQQGVSEYYFCGHMLAKSLGGLGGTDNIFAQDTNNNIGRWPKAEGAIRDKRDVLKPSDNMKVTVALAAREGKLRNVKIKGQQLDTIVNTETKIASKMLDI
jgi:hypothetical protein